MCTWRPWRHLNKSAHKTKNVCITNEWLRHKCQANHTKWCKLSLTDITLQKSNSPMPAYITHTKNSVGCMKPTNNKDMKTINFIVIHRIIGATILINFSLYSHNEVILLVQVSKHRQDVVCVSCTYSAVTHWFSRVLTVYRARVDFPVFACPIIIKITSKGQ